MREAGRACTVCVRSEQTDAAGERQRMEIRCKGRLSEREGVLYVLYEEEPEDGRARGGMRNLLKIWEDPPRVSLKKSGEAAWEMHFEAGKREHSAYRTPYGALEMGVDTKSVTLKKEREKTSLQLLYALSIQGENQADCRLEIEIS